MEDNILKRISILSLILLLLFGILQYIPEGRTYQNLGPEVILKVFATSFFSILLLLVLIYLILVGINSGYGMKDIIPEKYLALFYNSIVLMSFFIIVLIVFFGLLINTIVLIPILTPRIGSYFLMVFLIIWLTTFAILFQKYIA